MATNNNKELLRHEHVFFLLYVLPLKLHLSFCIYLCLNHAMHHTLS